VRRLVQDAPEPRDVAAGDRSGDVLGCVAEIHGIDLCVACCGEQTRREWEDAAAICGGGLGEDADDLGGVVLCELFEGVERGAW
jgi:hypothetical protein